MAVLTHSKNWQFDVNKVQVYVSQEKNSTDQMFYIKEALVGNGSWTNSDGYAITPTSESNWTIIGCNGDGSDTSASSYGMDGYDRWQSVSDIDPSVGSGGKKPWIVLQNDVLNYQILFGFDTNVSSYFSDSEFYLSFNGFGVANGGTDGTASTQPTATDQVKINDDRWIRAAHSSNQILHFMKSDDGYSFRMITSEGGDVDHVWFLEKIENSNSSWTEQVLCYVRQGAPTYSQLSGSTEYFIGLTNGDSTYNYMLTGETRLSSGSLLADDYPSVNGISGFYSVYPIGIGRPDPFGGKYGDISDLWWGSGGVPNYSSYPGDDSRQFIQFNDLIYPWNKSAVVII